MFWIILANINIQVLCIQNGKGKKPLFEIFIWVGYVFGIIRKVIQIQAGSGQDFLFYMAFFFYCLNLLEVTIDIALYFRNKKLDRERDSGNVSDGRLE